MLRLSFPRICGSLILACFTACQTPNPVPKSPDLYSETPTAPMPPSTGVVLDPVPVLNTFDGTVPTTSSIQNESNAAIPTAPIPPSTGVVLDPVLEDTSNASPTVQPTTSVQGSSDQVVPAPDSTVSSSINTTTTSPQTPVIIGGSGATTDVITDEAVDGALSQAVGRASLPQPLANDSNQKDYFRDVQSFDTGSTSIKMQVK